MNDILQNWLETSGLSDPTPAYISWGLLALAVLIVAWLTNFVARRIFVAAIARVVRKSRTNWDDALLKHNVFSRLSHIAPAMVIYFSAYLFGEAADSIQRFSLVYMFIVGLSALYAFLNAAVEIYESYEVSRHHPIKGFVQIAKIIISVFVIIFAISTLMNRSPWFLLSGLGAMTAVLLLVFKDTILGLVASVQLSMNNMVQIGDWIEMPKYGADGDVIDISLHTIKIQNWDKTITTIPAYALISDSFKNWRGMAESGGRRIKRSINIDISSIKLCSEEMLNRFERIHLLKDYVRTKKQEIEKYNEQNKVDTSELVNGRRMTNVGTFRAFVASYLQSLPVIHKKMTFLVRQLPPGPNGLPIEIYVFSNDQEWARFEAIQADIFDHLLAILPHFDLRVFQLPTGYDLRSISTARTKK